MQNVVPVERVLAEQALGARLDTYADEARRLIDAAFAVMRREATIDPRVSDVVREAGLSNQAFYRHFRSKDALLLAVLADGQQRLLDYLHRRIARVDDPAERVREWIRGVMEQARNVDAAAATRPFAIGGPRLSARFPNEMAGSRALLVDTIRDAVRDAGGDPERDALLVHELAMARMNDAVVRGSAPTDAEIEHLVAFCLAALGGPGATDGA